MVKISFPSFFLFATTKSSEFPRDLINDAADRCQWNHEYATASASRRSGRFSCRCERFLRWAFACHRVIVKGNRRKLPQYPCVSAHVQSNAGGSLVEHPANIQAKAKQSKTSLKTNTCNVSNIQEIQSIFHVCLRHLPWLETRFHYLGVPGKS